MEIYEKLPGQLSEYKTISSNIYSSKITELTLKEYCTARIFVCHNQHAKCTLCQPMIHAAELIMREGIISMSKVFRTVFPNVTYHALNARRRLLQMPLFAVRIDGELFLMPSINGLDYYSITAFLSNRLTDNKKTLGISKCELKQLLKLVSNEGDRECVKYAVCKASSITPTQARRLLGMRFVH